MSFCVFRYDRIDFVTQQSIFEEQDTATVCLSYTADHRGVRSISTVFVNFYGIRSMAKEW